MSATNGTMKSLKVTDSQGNIYVLTPVDTAAREAAASASTLATTLNKDSVKYKNIVNNPPEYSVSSAYAVGDYCYKDNELYKCNTDIASPGETWDATHWDKIIVNDLIAEAQTTADSAVDAIDEAKNLQFDDMYFTVDDSDDDDVRIGLNGSPIGVDTATPITIVSDTPEGFVLGADTLFTSSLVGDHITEFSDEYPYALGTMVLHESKIYECTTAVQTAGEWDASDWTELSIVDLIFRAKKVDIVTLTGTVSGTTREATLVADKYCKVTVDDTDTALVLSLADRSSDPTVLQQVGFEFTLGASSVLASMEVHSGGYSLPVKGDTAFTAGKIYQGTVVDGLVTICEFDQPTALS